MATEFGSRLQALPEFVAFRTLITNNLGVFPNITFDRTGLSGHRIRLFQDPPAVELRYSERALARSIGLSDLIAQSWERGSPATLASGLFAMRGAELLKRNRFAGLAFIVRGYRDDCLTTFPHSEVVAKAIESAAKPGETISLINLLLPLAHEIGHLAEAQRLCPSAIHGDELLETYNINYELVAPFTGEFDYKSALNDPNSPLNLKLLREEIASDYFGALALSNFIAQGLKSGDAFPLNALGHGLLLFTLVMGLDALCFKETASKRFLQEITLAMHCRYSVMVDNLRGCSKAIFQSQSNFASVTVTIDEAVDRLVEHFDTLYRLAWDAFLVLMTDSETLAHLNFDEILQGVGMQDVSTQLGIADFLEIICQDMDGYPTSAENEVELRGYVDKLRYFRTVIVEGKNVRLLR